LANGTKIPRVAFGIAFRGETDPFDQAKAEAFLSALKMGYTHIDGARIYYTDPEGGWAIKRSFLPRSSLFITSKTHPSLGIARKDIESDLRLTLKEMEIDYVDLYLIHNPFFPNPKEFGIKEAWAQMEKLKEMGLTKEIGVSNFEVVDLEKVLAVAKVKPVVNQIELHPSIYEPSKPVIEFCKKHDILIEGFGPLTPIGRGASALSSSPLLPLLDTLSKKYSVTTAQILLKWQLQRGFIPVTASMNPERQRVQMQLTGWEMEESELEEIEKTGAEMPYRQFGWGPGMEVYESVL